jgi:negative regulator of flagellin synthesis FlgM
MHGVQRQEISVTDKISGIATSDQVAPVKGSSGGGIVTDKSQGESAAAGVSAAQSGDTVTLTNSARSLQKIEETIAKTPVVSAAKVTAVQQSLAAGTYQVNPAQVADKLLQFESGLK